MGSFLRSDTTRRVIIHNNGTLDDLRDHVAAAIDAVFAKEAA